MNENEAYTRVMAEDGHNYICPLKTAHTKTPLSLDMLDDCVEAEVVGRYSGNLKIVANT